MDLATHTNVPTTLFLTTALLQPNLFKYLLNIYIANDCSCSDNNGQMLKSEDREESADDELNDSYRPYRGWT